ncbi:MAG: hypothetical protein O8C64_15420 [Candidatus Methanoperedens sp.]|nr:hypothetical protein [Candidatus Methanoperedens sp.]MCZ7405210.1 hypothetical protein [Candidatus Methanoperedens sp.]
METATTTKLRDLTVGDLLEDFTALSSKEYLTSIREAREDYKHRRVKNLEEIDV